MSYNWQSPRKPTYTTGRIVIHSDDGRLWDYTQFFKIIQKAVTSKTQFYPLKHGIFCPAINTGYIDAGWHETVDLPTMDWDMIKEIADKGGEILSHGKYHLYLHGTPVIQPLTAGDTTLQYSNSQGRPREGFKFYVVEGDKRDDFIVSSYNHVGTGENNSMEFSPPLSNDYTVAARLHLHEDMMEEQLGGCITDLADRGIECKHHINAWYAHSQTAEPFLRNYFDSVITSISMETENPSESNLFGLSRTKDLRNYTFEEIDNLIDEIQIKDSVAFVQNHGAENPVVNDNLEYLITSALGKGVRLVTHSKAVEFIKSKQ